MFEQLNFMLENILKAVPYLRFSIIAKLFTTQFRRVVIIIINYDQPNGYYFRYKLLSCGTSMHKCARQKYS